MTQASVTARTDGSVVVLTMTGEVDFSNAAEIADNLASAVPKAACGAVIDLTDVTYIDSSGVQMLFTLRSSLERDGRSLVLCVPTSSPLRGLLKLTGVAEVITIVEDCDEGVEGASQPSVEFG